MRHLGIVACIGSSVLLSACGAESSVHLAVTAAAPTASPVSAPCVRTVHGVIAASQTISPGYLPKGFQLTEGDPNDAANQMTTYGTVGRHSSHDYVEVRITDNSSPLSASIIGRAGTVTTTIQGHRGLVATGLPAPFEGVYWKPRPQTLASVVGWGLTTGTTLRVARALSVSPGGIVSLPVRTGQIYGRAAAIGRARRAAIFIPSGAVAKLTSWTEVQTLIERAYGSEVQFKGPSPLNVTPWAPAWAVIVYAKFPLELRRSSRNGVLPGPGASLRDPNGNFANAELIMVNAASGHQVPALWMQSNAGWFAAITDRDPALKGCPGGSTSRLPFGVLTRDEESFTVRGLRRPQPDGVRNSVIMKLTTIRILAQHGLCGGLGADCSINQLVWPTITIERAASGKSLPCPPPGFEGPSPRGRSTTKRVTVEFGISNAGNSEGGCGPPPKWVYSMKDLAPAP